MQQPPDQGSISESAVQPRNVRNTEHLVVLSTVYSSTSVRCAACRGIILRQIAIKDVGEKRADTLEAASVPVPRSRYALQDLWRSFGRTAADTVRVDDAHIRVKPLLSITFKCPQTIEKRLRIRHFFTLAGLHLRLRPVDGGKSRDVKR